MYIDDLVTLDNRNFENQIKNNIPKTIVAK